MTHNIVVMKKFLKWVGIIIVLLVLCGMLALGFYISSSYISARNIALDEEALSSPYVKIEVFDNENAPIEEENQISRAFADIDKLSENTLNAFISIEDKDFYKHHGVNYKRIAGAMLNNLKSRSFSQGASTITQQLVKNTQLSSEKTISRKIKEVALAQKIEAKYDKRQILEQYLNIIYFGNNCYGIESASEYYFSKKAEDLTVSEAAMLAGLIKSPSKYSPIKNPENCKSRRNLVLSEMNNDGLLSDSEYSKVVKKDLSLALNTERKNRLNSYSQAAIDEAESILGLPARQIALKGYKLYTYQNTEKQAALENALEGELGCDKAGIVIDNQTHAVVAYIGDSSYKILEAKRQPGSCIKPILVYAPAMNEDIIYPCSQILDEKTTIAEYTPKNVGNVYRGYVSAREALSKSINIPAVKVLSYLGIDKGKQYAEEMGIEFDQLDNSYTLALGGMTYGVNIEQLASAYTTFANGGKYSPAKFISFITDKNNRLVYVNKAAEKEVLREDVAFLTTDMLKTCAKSGTAKRLSEIGMDIASKTGTVGKSGSRENLDAWNVSFTRDQTCAVWLGNLDNQSISYAGGNQPTEMVKKYFQQVGDSSTFEMPKSVVERSIDGVELSDNHRIVLANDYMPERYTHKELFSIFNLPKDISEKLATIETTSFIGRVEAGKAKIKFDAKDYMSYIFSSNGKKIAEVSNKSGQQEVELMLSQDKQKIDIEYHYTLAPEICARDSISFVKTNKTENNIDDKKWFI